eukprot:gene18388-22006_t
MELTKEFFESLSIDITSITFDSDSEQPLTPGCIPSTVKKVIFDEWYDQEIPIGALPSSLTHLSFGQYYDHHILGGALPQSLTHLTFESYGISLSVGSLPQNITHLSLDGEYNQPLTPGLLPQSITHLLLGQWFDEPLDHSNLPPHLTHLVLGELYSHPLDSLPLTLQHLTHHEVYSGSLTVTPSLTHVRIMLDEDHSNEEQLYSTITRILSMNVIVELEASDAKWVLSISNHSSSQLLCVGPSLIKFLDKTSLSQHMPTIINYEMNLLVNQLSLGSRLRVLCLDMYESWITPRRLVCKDARGEVLCGAFHLKKLRFLQGPQTTEMITSCFDDSSL